MHLKFDKGGLRFFFFTAAIRGRQPLLSRIVPRAPGRQRPGEASPEAPRSGRPPRRDPCAGWGVELELLRKEPGTRWIRTVAHGLPTRCDPSAEESRYLAEGRQLVLSSFPTDIPEFPVNWTNCHIMNKRNAALCARAAAGAQSSR